MVESDPAEEWVHPSKETETPLTLENLSVDLETTLSFKRKRWQCFL
jgi:hypothetical protein